MSLRVQKTIFFVLLGLCIVMTLLLWQLRERAHRQQQAAGQNTPTEAPLISPAEPATLVVANDTDGALLAQVLTLPLPQDAGSRARAILGKLLDLYAASDATHPVPGGAPGIAQVFLLPLDQQFAQPLTAGKPHQASALRPEPIPLAGDAAPMQTAANNSAPKPYSGPQLAVVNLTAAFAANHPSGLETETLTIQSICATLHANLPRIVQVRFLVDGQPRQTLAGHADLTRTYLAADAAPAAGEPRGQ